MTETPSSPTDPTDDDLLASLYLDGEATPAERAKVEADPELMRLVEAFASTAESMGAVAPPAELSRVQIAAALDLFDEQHAEKRAGAATSAPAAEVRSLADRREQKTQRALPTWLGAAAAAVLVIGGLGFAASTLGGGDDSDTAALDAMANPARSSSNAESAQLAEESAESTDDAMEDDAMEDADAMETEAMDEVAEEEAEEAAADSDDEAMQDDAMEDDSADDAGDETTAAPSPIPIDDLDATSASEYFELLSEEAFLPIAASPCADSPLVQGLFGVDQFLAVVFDGAPSSLLVQQGSPATAVIVGPTCEIVLE